MRRGERTDVSLAAAEATILLYAPVTRVRAVDVAPLGFVNMLNGGGAVRSIEVR